MKRKPKNIVVTVDPSIVEEHHSFRHQRLKLEFTAYLGGGRKKTAYILLDPFMVEALAEKLNDFIKYSQEKVDDMRTSMRGPQ